MSCTTRVSTWIGAVWANAPPSTGGDDGDTGDGSGGTGVICGIPKAEYFEVCKKVSENDTQLLSALLSDISQTNDRDVLSRLTTTVKTHKNHGCVTFRAVHATPRSPWAPAMRLLARWLDHTRLQLPHLLKNTEQLCSVLRTKTFPPSCKFVKGDVKEFFMTGDHITNISCSAECVHPSVKGHYTDLAQFILKSQYVHLPGGATHKITKGTGMGLIISDQIANTSLYVLGERDFALDATVQRAAGILAYFRYMDDLLFITDGKPFSEGFYDFWFEFQRRIAPYKIVCSVSSHSMTFLELQITKQGDFHHSGHLQFWAERKESAIGQPLSHASDHPISVHMSWPYSLQRRMSNLCSTTKLARMIESNQEKLWQAQGISKATLSPKKRQHHFGTLIRMVVPFCSHLKALRPKKLLQQANGFLAGLPCNIRIGWAYRLDNPHLVNLLRRNQTNTENRIGGDGVGRRVFS